MQKKAAVPWLHPVSAPDSAGVFVSETMPGDEINSVSYKNPQSDGREPVLQLHSLSEQEQGCAKVWACLFALQKIGNISVLIDFFH